MLQLPFSTAKDFGSTTGCERRQRRCRPIKCRGKGREKGVGPRQMESRMLKIGEGSRDNLVGAETKPLPIYAGRRAKYTPAIISRFTASNRSHLSADGVEEEDERETEDWRTRRTRSRRGGAADDVNISLQRCRFASSGTGFRRPVTSNGFRESREL